MTRARGRVRTDASSDALGGRGQGGIYTSASSSSLTQRVSLVPLRLVRKGMGLLLLAGGTRWPAFGGQSHTRPDPGTGGDEPAVVG